MPTFIVLMNYTDQGIKGIKETPSRIAEWEKAIAAGGGKKIGGYTVMGQYDRVVIVETPSDEVAMSALLQVGRAGNVRTTTLKAFTDEQFAEMVKKLP